ncbi:hypothetical protein HDU76_010373, partial [Blyttiomyces sp. JEL0837]
SATTPVDDETNSNKSESDEDDGGIVMNPAAVSKTVTIIADDDVKELNSSDPVVRLISTNARRFQIALLLLCDASTHDPALLSTSRLQFLKSVGNALGWEQVCAHDVSPSRCFRDLAGMVSEGGVTRDGGIQGRPGDGGPVNAFLWWLVREEGGGEEGVVHVLKRVVEAVEGRLEGLSGEVEGKVVKRVKELVDGKGVGSHVGTSGEYVSPGDVEKVFKSVFANGDDVVQRLFWDEKRRFVKEFGKEDYVTGLIETEAVEGHVFDMECFWKVTRLYRDYYGVGGL